MLLNGARRADPLGAHSAGDPCPRCFAELLISRYPRERCYCYACGFVCFTMPREEAAPELLLAERSELHSGKAQRHIRLRRKPRKPDDPRNGLLNLQLELFGNVLELQDGKEQI